MEIGFFTMPIHPVDKDWRVSLKEDREAFLLADELGFSLGKLNYCLKSLQEKGWVKIKNFSKNPKKLNYIYILTPRGLASKTKLTIKFMQRKMREYDELKAELKKK